MSAFTCRRCSECPNSPHHWLDNSECCGPEDPSHVCKHCPATGMECPDCDGTGIKDFDGFDRGPDEPLCPMCSGYGVIEVGTDTTEAMILEEFPE